MVKKKTRRSKTKHPALHPELNLKTRYEELDQDYINQLSEKEKDWLNAFNEEWVNANFKHSGPKLAKTKAEKKRSYDKNNARNRCILTRAKASGCFEYTEDMTKDISHSQDPEQMYLAKEAFLETKAGKALVKELKNIDKPAAKPDKKGNKS